MALAPQLIIDSLYQYYLSNDLKINTAGRLQG